jgi:hypothetical protein
MARTEVSYYTTEQVGKVKVERWEYQGTHGLRVHIGSDFQVNVYGSADETLAALRKFQEAFASAKDDET